MDRLARLFVAIVDGSLLVVPMLVMSFNPSTTKSLVVVSAVVLFALLMNLSFHTDNKDILTATATATYAAVLVVFFVTSGTES